MSQAAARAASTEQSRGVPELASRATGGPRSTGRSAATNARAKRTPPKKAATPRPSAAHKASRAFRLTVHPAKGDTYGISIAEADGVEQSPTSPLVTATAAQTGRVLDAVLAAVKGSGHQPGRLAVKRGQPIDLDEAEGVRLAVIMLATQPITVNDRIRRIVAGVNFMSIEETYYWYAKCVGSSHAQARKAIRILLADPKNQD